MYREKIRGDAPQGKTNFPPPRQKAVIGKEIYGALENIKNTFGVEWQKLPASAKKREVEEAMILFTYNTNAIEGSKITSYETRELLINNLSPKRSLNQVKETREHARIFADMINGRPEMSKDLILEWHRKIFGETEPDIAGKFRDYFVSIGGYLPPDWTKIEAFMENLFRFINSSNMNPVELAARSHYRFEKIHPFGDGNGRIGRLIMNGILWNNDYPFSIIKFEDRNLYYAAFEKGEDEFTLYFLETYINEHQKGGLTF
ncbi:MAG: Fic family protein [Candidatus Micrarchaeota archaeon]|nr:Fic family protein [Candidatus Micrarchaeota archaeon]